jgi:hypothetical protein
MSPRADANRPRKIAFGYLRAVLHLGPRARVVFAACWIAGQAALVLTAAQRADHVFGFRMFPEASTMQIRLYRERSRGDDAVEAPNGEWSATDASGQLRHFSWRDRVRDPVLAQLGARVFASYGASTQLARLQRALDDVADHIPEDDETVRLRADVVVWKNGHEPTTVTLESHARPGRR